MTTLVASFLVGSSLFLPVGNKVNYKSLDEFEFWQDPLPTAALAAIGLMKNQ